MPRKSFLLCLLLISSVCMLTTCKKDKQESVTGGVVIADNVSQIPNETWDKNFISMDSTNYTLNFSDNIDSAMKFKPGDILISTTGDGLLRKVTSVKTAGGKTQVQTEFASLVDAVEQGELDLDQPLYPSQVKSIEYNVPGMRSKTEIGKGSTAIDFSWDINSVVYDSDRSPVTVNDQIKLEGEFGFKLRLVTKIDIGLFKGLKEIKFGIAASQNLDLNLVASIAYQLPQNLDIVLATIRFSPICVYIGAVPVVLNPVLKIHVGVEGNFSATITTGISESLSFNAGIHYVKYKGWEPYCNYDKDFSYYWPKFFIDANVVAYLKPEFEMKVYGVGGPYVNMKLFGRVAAELVPNPAIEIFAGVSIGAGARISIFDKYELDYSIEDILKYERRVFNKSLTQAIKAPTVSTSIGSYTSTSAILGGAVTGSGGSPVTERGIYWGTSSDPVHSGTKLALGSDSGSFSKNIENLRPNTTYYVRAYAINSGGPGLGEEKNFITLNNLTAVDVDGNAYKTVTIGSQVWFSENLKTTRLNDGQNIPQATDNSAWTNLTGAGYCWYNNDKAVYGSTYGALYNWYAVNTGNLCPAGWHVPTDTDWIALTDYLGGVNVAGGKLKEAGLSHWETPNTAATNEVGFNALPGGHRAGYGGFGYNGSYGYWWSGSGFDDANAWLRRLNKDSAEASRMYSEKDWGRSVRCVKD
jgi:uncharacterized protein (TIGR02145 family)